MTGGAMLLGGARPRTVLRTLWDGVRAHPSAQGGAVIVVQLVLIGLCQPAIFVLMQLASNAVVVHASGYWGRVGVAQYKVEPKPLGIPSSGDEAFAVIVGTAGVLLAAAGVVAYIPFRIVARRAGFPIARFVRCWWRSCLWGVPMLPAGACLISLARPQLHESGLAELGVAVYLIAGPAVCAAREARRGRLRMSRWRPVCPECGYSLRRLLSNRCPECGEAVPTTSRVSRRWAVRRLPWERRNRGSLLFAYIKTVLLIVFCPCRAARGLVMPDRFGRAVRWAAVHLAVLALIGVAAGSNLYFSYWARGQLLRYTLDQSPMSSRPAVPTHATVARWAAQSWAAWLVPLAALPIIGMALAAALPSQHPVGRRATYKWSLYGCVIIGLVAVLLTALQIVATYHRGWGVILRLCDSPQAWPSGLSYTRFLDYAPRSFVLLPLAYALWWACGAAASPYGGRRGLGHFLLHAIAFLAAWWAFRAWLFPPGALGVLL